MDEKIKTSRIPGFYQRGLEERIDCLAEQGELSPEALQFLRGGGGLSPRIADRMSENVIGTLGLPLSVGLNFRVNNRDVLVPMAVEEPSVVAAASNAARLVRMQGGFFGEATSSVMTTQVQLDEVPDVQLAAERLEERRAEILLVANEAIPSMVARGGGAKDLEVRIIDAPSGLMVCHIYVDVGDAMGANIVDTVAEATAPQIAQIAGGKIGLRILSNLPMRRRVKVWAEVSESAVGSAELADGIARASRFAELDSFRAVTHNKGIMNGVDAAALALGQDWRSIEAGAHAYAAQTGRYLPLAVWKRTDLGLRGELEMPMAVGTVGGSTRVHQGVRTAFEMVGVSTAAEVGIIIAAVGLASNLAALKALAGEGIQQGHMRLHNRKHEEERQAEIAARLETRP